MPMRSKAKVPHYKAESAWHRGLKWVPTALKDEKESCKHNRPPMGNSMWRLTTPDRKSSLCATKWSLGRHARFASGRASLRMLAEHRDGSGIGDDTLAKDSRCPHHSPAKTTPARAAQVVAARKKAPCFGARHLVYMFELPVQKEAARRILRGSLLIRKINANIYLKTTYAR